MRPLALAILLLAALAACSSARDGSGEGGASLGDLGSSISGGFGRNTDTYGTQRRVDVYGGSSTAPSLPSIGSPGFGK